MQNQSNPEINFDTELKTALCMGTMIYVTIIGKDNTKNMVLHSRISVCQVMCARQDESEVPDEK